MQILPIVTKQSANQAVASMNYVIERKLAMMPPKELIPRIELHFYNSATNTIEQGQIEDIFQLKTLTNVHRKYVRKVTLFQGGSIKASEVSGRHLMQPPTPLAGSSNKYPTVAMVKFLECMERLGLASSVKPTNAKSRNTCLFRKRKFDDVPTETKNKLRKLNIT